jgi:hypothetical protein
MLEIVSQFPSDSRQWFCFFIYSLNIHMSTNSLTVTRQGGIEVTGLNSNSTASSDLSQVTATITNLASDVTILKLKIPPVLSGIQQLQATVSTLQINVLALQNVPESNVTVSITGGEVTVMERSTTISTTLVSKADLDALTATITS